MSPLPGTLETLLPAASISHGWVGLASHGMKRTLVGEASVAVFFTLKSRATSSLCEGCCSLEGLLGR